MNWFLTLLIYVCVMASAVGAACSAEPDSTDKTQAKPPTLTKSPTTAVLYSLVLPGLGQYYTENYWKIPLFTGTCAVTAYLFFKNNADYNSTSQLVDDAIAAEADPAAISALKAQREAFRDNRDLAGVVFLAAYGLAAIDAYVGAHLFDFSVSDDLSMRVFPNRTSILAVNLRYSW